MIGEARPDPRRSPRPARPIVSSTEAVSIGLIVTELMINALKHAFGHTSIAGLIIVSYEAVDKAAWRLTVS